MEEFKNKHEDRLPTVRLQKAVLENFKSVEYGEIVFSCGKHQVPYGTHSDILGIYGQNGSGKTTFIEALAILKSLMAGVKVSPAYADCIKKGAEFARAEFTFDLQYPECDFYPNGETRKIVYAFSLATEPISPDDKANVSGDDFFQSKKYKHKVRVFNEVITISGVINGEKYRSQTLIDTSAEAIPFGPNAKTKFFYTKNPAKDIDLMVSKKMSSQNSKSFIFASDTLSIFDSDPVQSIERTAFFEMLIEMRHYARYYLYVIDTRSSGLIRLGFAIPFYTRQGQMILDNDADIRVPNEIYDLFSKSFESMNMVLQKLVPGMNVAVRKTADVKLEDGSDGVTFEVISKRGEIELPIQCESDGIRKIISSLNLLIHVYNDRSITVAIDEFDAGIYEYLLGEILKAIEESGKGQFIFTSHNLRPLEIIDKDSILFTTTNPQNRYIRLKNIGLTNNLRDVYFREILLNEQDEKIYNATKRYLINAAFTRAAKMELEGYHGEEK